MRFGEERTLEKLVKHVQRHILRRLAIDGNDKIPDVYEFIGVAGLALHYHVQIHQIVDLQARNRPPLST